MEEVKTGTEYKDARSSTLALSMRVRSKLWKAYYEARQHGAISESESKRLDKICSDLTALINSLEV